MATKIRVLDDATINQITAGEVVENPASVVKELVENSIDAQSTEITIEIVSGGRQLIRIIDDGCGMERDDSILCLERHATSKIRRLDDIYTTGSMGFRGEAIPSIASISKLTVITSTEIGKAGTMVLVDGGRILKYSDATRSRGTTVEVKSLFFNVPVRRKFQKSPAHDQAEIVKVVTKLALAHPTITFQLIADQQTLIMTRGSAHPQLQNQVEARIQDLLGGEFLQQLIPLHFEQEQFVATGWIGLPTSHRPNRMHQFLFINHRAVSSPPISQAVREGYGTTLPTGRFPQFVLHMKMDGSRVDVNVHPQKLEVRLRDEMLLKETMIRAVESALQEKPSWCEEPVDWILPVLPPAARMEEPTFYPQAQEETRPLPMTRVTPSNPVLPTLFAETTTPAPIVRKSARVLATLPNYILAQVGSDDLVVVDQRAAHERVLYERLTVAAASDSEMQQLLLPITLEMTPTEATVIRSQIEPLNQLGIAIREFGPSNFVVEAIPPPLKERQVIELVQLVATELGTEVSMLPKGERLAQLAARQAIPEDTRLTVSEAQALLDALMNCRLASVCPRGRPTYTSLNSARLSQHFRG
jgi:DNA mismatch repair protein MutL